MKNYFLALLAGISIVTVSCGDAETPEIVTEENTVLTEDEMIASIKQMDDSLAALINEVVQSNIPMPKLAYHEAINRSKELYATYPKSDFAPMAVEKIQSMYEAIRVPELAAQWRDTLLLKYPNYEGNIMAIQFQAMYYDMEKNNLERAEEYYKMALETGKLDSLTKDQIQSRLDNIDLTYDELIEKRMKEIEEIQ